MFTGIIEEQGEVVSIELEPTGARIVVRAPRLAPLAHVDDSIAIGGCCLTVVAREADLLSFDAVPETLARTALARLRPGDAVNLEDALRAGEPFGGHFVQGHVDGVGEVVDVAAEGIGARLRVRVPEGFRRYVVEKGSVTLAGVSLTIADVHDDGFSVALIPHTLRMTTLGQARVGDRVNLEADVLAKHVERLLAR